MVTNAQLADAELMSRVAAQYRWTYQQIDSSTFLLTMAVPEVNMISEKPSLSIFRTKGGPGALSVLRNGNTNRQQDLLLP